ncbi:MAG: carbohydrate kinase family protein [Candidatus Aenigmarchaeota archaeon]|nr:carbohydrate kinase family protein [Candidatus Aenigmarchaeota archaeon]
MVVLTVLGDINIDLITLPFKKLPEKDKQIVVDAIEISPGGSSFNLALAASRLGIKTKFIGKVGDDEYGKMLVKIGEKNGIKMKVKKSGKTGITLALTFSDGTRSFISFKGANDSFSLEDFNLDEIEGKFLAIGGYNLLNSLRKDVPKIIEYAKIRGLKTSLDPNWDPDGWKEERVRDIYATLPKLDFFLPDINEAEAITYTKNDILMAKKLLNLGASTVLIKEGAKGCLLCQKEYIKLIPSFRVHAINTTGAGDVFHAAFIKYLLEKKEIEEAVRFANAAAALSTTKHGIERYPTEKQVNEFLKALHY